MLQAIIASFSQPGSGFMWAITAALALGLAVGLDRVWYLYLRLRVDESAVLGALLKGDLAAAKAAAGDHPVGLLLKAGSEAPNAEGAWDAMSAESTLIEQAVRNRVSWLATVGNLSTMLGLLGTVYGLIFAFQGLGDASAAERSVRLSQGIATAMTTTALGLMVAIPALALHTLVEGRAGAILAFCEAAAARLVASRRAQG